MIRFPYLLVFCFLCGPIAVWALVGWETTVIDVRVRVQAPVRLAELNIPQAAGASTAPEATKREAMNKSRTSKLYMARDGEAIYGLLRVDGSLSGMPKSAVGNRSELQSFYKNFTEVIVKDDKGVILQTTPFTTGGLEGIDCKYIGIHQFTGKRVIKFNRSLLIGNICYSMVYISLVPFDSLGIAGTTERLRFFNSLQVQPAN